MHFHPWDGTTASTGDASYQLAFGSSGTNGSGVPILGLRKGIDTTWNSWYYLAAYGVNYKTGALYATQLIDSDSTGYYADPGSTSILNALSVATTTPTDVSLGVNGSIHLATTNYLYMGGSIGAVGGWGTRDWQSGGLRYINCNNLDINNVGYGSSWNFSISTGGIVSSTVQMRAPIFYDSANTSFYVDPASTSVLANVRATSFTNDATGSVRVMFPGGGSYASTSSSVAGAIKIRLPVSWSYTMMRFTVKIYEYTTNEAFEVNCGGYNYGSYWVNTFAYILGNPGTDRNFNVRFGHDGTYCCVYIGETSSSWTYPQVTVTDFEGGYSGYGAAEWDDGWAISFETSFGTISATESNSQIGRVSSIFYDYDNTGYYIDPASTSNINAMTMAGQLNMHAGSYEGSITFGSSSTWRCGIRQHDDGDAELRIWAANAGGMIFLATGYNGEPASISRPTDGLCVQNNNVGIGDFSASDPSYDLHVKGNIYADGGWFRVSGGNGYYWETYDTRIYSDTSDYLKTRSNLGIQHQDRSGNIKGYTYFDGAGFGMLAGNANWWLNNRAGDDASLVIGGYNGYNAYGSVTSRRLFLGGADVDAAGNYYIGTNLENYGGNYNKLDLRWHTGIRMGAQLSYGGIRFFDSEDMGTLRFHIEGTSGYIYKYVWMYTNTNGMFSDTNSAHIRPNISSTYGQWEIIGSRTSYGGIYDSYSGVNGIMYDGGGSGGVYREANGRWFWYWNNSNQSMGIGSSTTSSSYVLYASGSIYSTSNIVAASDARLKENVITVDNALDKVNQLRGVYYNRIDDEEKKRKIGVIAQEVEPVIPEVVTHDKENDRFGVDYGNLAGLFIEAIKKLTDEVNSLKKEIEVLKNGSSN